MADILIRGMEMPKEKSLWLCIKTDGTVYNIKPGGIGTAHAVGTAIPLPEGHGRLGDLDKINASLEAMQEIEHNQKAQPYSWSYAYMEMQSILDDVPTIIPAEGGNAGGNP